MSRLNQLLNKNKQVNERYGVDNAGSVDVKSTTQNNNVAAPDVRTEREVRVS